MKVELDLLTDEEIYEKVMREEIPAARQSLVIATAFVKQTTIEFSKGAYGPFLKLVDELLARKVMVMILFAGKPSKSFVDNLNSFPRVQQEMLVRICPGNHAKIVLIDGVRLNMGSANPTDAGMGRRSSNKRNLEFGFFTTDPRVIGRISRTLQEIWEGEPCTICQTKRVCMFEHDRFLASIGCRPQDQRTHPIQ